MIKPHRIVLVLVAVVIFVVIGVYMNRAYILRSIYGPTETCLPQGITASAEPETAFEVVADNLKVPWEIVFLPGGELLVTERGGTLKRIGKKGHTFRIEDVEHVGEGGLLGMALHPQFLENQWLYLYLTTRTAEGLRNRIERYRLEGDALSEKKTIIDDIPGGRYHDGGRIGFGPDGYLYITTGDAGTSKLAQDTGSLAGKILRLTDEGSVPLDNPFGNAVYSYGHRNSQGLAWDSDGHLWASEHGRSGILSGFDELNLIEKGKNYGWPVIQGDEVQAGMESPVAHSGSKETWAPAGIAYWNGLLLFGGLRGESLYQARIVNESELILKSHFRGQFGRIRAVAIGPDGLLYIGTSNTDGRGKPHPNDDKIIRISPQRMLGE